MVSFLAMLLVLAGLPNAARAAETARKQGPNLSGSTRSGNSRGGNPGIVPPHRTGRKPVGQEPLPRKQRGATMKGHPAYGMLCSLVLVAALVLPSTAHPETVQTGLDGFHEVPSLSTTGQGTFKAFLNRKARTVSYEVSYAGLQGDVLQSHIHFARPDTNGGVAVFLCTNLGNAPAGVPNPPPLCPGPRSGMVTGTFEAGDIIGPGGQGIAAGEFDELLDAIDAGATYVNVHTALFPGGELRGNLRGKGNPF